MGKLFKISSAFLALILFGTLGDTNAQAKKTKKPKPIRETVVVEYPASPDDPFYKMTVELPAVDKVEVSYVKPIRKDQSPDAQPKAMETIIAPFGGAPRESYQVVAKQILREEAAEAFAAQWRKILRGPGAGCFAPAYRISFWAKEQLLLQTNVCYHCRNLTIPEKGNVEIRGFNAEGESGKELLKRLKELLPQSDTERNHQ